MNIKDILGGGKKVVRQNIRLIAEDYKRITKRVVCMSCPSDVSFMILELKNHYKMTSFKFKKDAACYKYEKGGKVTISNDNLTDENAIKFIKKNPNRINLFSKYPENWVELCGLTNEDIKNIDVKGVVDLSTTDGGNGSGTTDGGNGSDDCCDDNNGEPCEECIQRKREELSRMKLADLREAYPDIKATSIKVFVDKIIDSTYNKASN